MAKPQDRMIYQNSDGMWVNKRNDSNRASSLHLKQKEAEDAGRKCL